MKLFHFSKFIGLLLIPVIGLSNSFYSSIDAYKTIKTKEMNFNELWKSVDSLNHLGLFREAYTKVEFIYRASKDNKETEQIIKSLYYIVSYLNELENEGSIQGINRLEKELRDAGFPENAIIHSMLAELYSAYVNRESWSISDRKDVAGSPPDDLNEWSFRHFEEVISYHYFKSISFSQAKLFPLKKIEGLILNPGKKNYVFHTLYDLLAFRAISYFSNNESKLLKPEDSFVFNDPVALASLDTFLITDFPASDSSSFIKKTLILYKEVLAFHAMDKDPGILIDMDIKRLLYVNQYLIHEDKLNLLINQFQLLIKKFPDHSNTSEIYYHLADEYFKKSNLPKAATLCRFAINNYNKTYGATLCQTLLNTIEEKKLILKIEDNYLPNAPLLLRISYRNIKSFKGGIVPVSFKEFQEAKLQIHDTDIKKFLKNKKPAIERWIALPESMDYQEHETEIALDGLPVGQYIFVFKGEDMVSSFIPIQITRIGYFIKNEGTEKIEFQFFNKETTLPLSGISVLAIPVRNGYFSPNAPVITFKESWKSADNNGFLSYPLSSGAFQFKIADNADTILIEDQFFIGERYRIDPQVQLKTSIFTDRKIYRPGQTVFWKAILMEKPVDEKAIISTNKEVTISLIDPNGLLLEQISLVSNEMGSLSGQFFIPADLIKGNYTLVSSYGGTRENIQVEEYKRPQFEINIEKIPVGILGDSLKIPGSVQFFNGIFIENALVKWEITRKSISNGWRPSGRFFIKDAGYFISSGETATNSNGVFEIPFVAKPDFSIDADKRPAFQFEIKISVTSPSGEIQEKFISFNIGYERINLSAEVPEYWDKQKGSLNASLFLSDWNGEQVSGDIQVSIFKLKAPRQHFNKRNWAFPDKPLLSREEYIQFFPYLPYKEEGNLMELEVLNTVQENQLRIKGAGNVEIRAESWAAGYYLVKFSMPDDKGNKKFIRKLFFLFDSKEKNRRTKDWVDVDLDKDILNVKDTLKVKIAAAKEIKKVLVQFTTLTSTYKVWADVENTSELHIPVVEKEDGVGNLEVMAYFRNEPVFIRKTVKLIHPPEKLNVSYHRFTDRVTPGEMVQWEINISSENGQQPVETLATMFDASLESMLPHQWTFNNFQGNTFLPSGWVMTDPILRDVYASFLNKEIKRKEVVKYYPVLNDFNLFLRQTAGLRGMEKRHYSMAPPAMQAFKEPTIINGDLDQMEASVTPEVRAGADNETKIRMDLAETVFFLPHMLTDNKGNVNLSFKMKDALTRWKFMLFAHRKDLTHIFSEKYIVSSLPVMIQSNAPRFLRQGDRLNYAVLLTNTTNENVSGKVYFQLVNELKEQHADQKEQIIEITVPAGQTIPVLFPLRTPEKDSINALGIVIKFASADYSDAVKEWIPLLPSRILVTESRPFNLRENEKISFKWKNETGKELEKNAFDLQLTSNPTWIALKSLPYLMEFPYDCNEQLFNKLYANVLGTHLLTQYPAISNVLDEWKNDSGLWSELEKNEYLKSATLKETPWLSDAKNEKEQRLLISRLLDVPNMTREANRISKILSERQSSDGSWGWFPGGRGNWYITQYMLAGWGKLYKLGLLDQQYLGSTIKKASQYCDEQMLQYYKEQKKNKKEELLLPDIIIHYLYAQSFFNDRILSNEVKEAMAYFSDVARKNWLKMSIFQQGQLAVFWFRNGNRPLAETVINSLNDRSVKSRELGMYWKINSGYHWYENLTDIQSLMIEAFAETSFRQEYLTELKWALLQHKKTNHWETTKSTADAVYALLGGGMEKMVTDNSEAISVTCSPDTRQSLKTSIESILKDAEVATGSIHKRWEENELADATGEIQIQNNQKGIVWGSATWQYYKEISEINSFNSPFLSVSRSLFVKGVNKNGEILTPVDVDHKLKIGDRLIVRLIVKSDREMEYVHLNDKRAAGIEPEKVLSGYVFNGGLYYYESSSDSGTDFFIDYLPKGTFIIEYPVKVNASGMFSLGTSTVQCMYAPEFGSHTKGEKIYIGK